MKTCIRLTTTATILLGLGLFSPSVAANVNLSGAESLSNSQGKTSHRLIPVVEQNYPQCKDKCTSDGSSRSAGTR